VLTVDIMINVIILWHNMADMALTSKDHESYNMYNVLQLVKTGAPDKPFSRLRRLSGGS
jgi:hypothetical protein